MADPLKLLRDYALNRRPMKELQQGSEQLIVFGDVAFRRNVKTNLMVYGKTNEYYTLESLLLLWQKRDMAHTAYVREAAGLQIVPVTRPDRRELIDYLKGEREVPPSNVDLTSPVPLPVQIGKLTDPELDIKKSRYAAANQKEKERIETLLNAQPSAIAAESTKAIKDINDILTVEKIVKIREKAKLHKKGMIKPTDDNLFTSSQDDTMEGDYLDHHLKLRERIWLTRRSCLESQGKNFQKSVFSILQTMKAREEKGSKTEGPLPSRNAPDSNLSRPVPSQLAGYSRYDQEKFRKEETGDFQIETGLTFSGTSLKSITEGAKPLAGAVDRTSGRMETSAVAGDYANKPKRVSRTPIIIIPAAGTSLITMYNVRDLLQDLRFVSTEEKKARGLRRENEVLVQRQKEGGLNVAYRVVDNALKLTMDEWDRVVAVFVQGPAWQFKGWQWNGNPTEIFSRLAAFHIKNDEQKLDSNVAKWSVHVLSLSKTKRHLDRAILLNFWQILDKYIVKYKPHLRF